MSGAALRTLWNGAVLAKPEGGTDAFGKVVPAGLFHSKVTIFLFVVNK